MIASVAAMHRHEHSRTLWMKWRCGPSGTNLAQPSSISPSLVHHSVEPFRGTEVNCLSKIGIRGNPTTISEATWGAPVHAFHVSG
jgi:hypothetical protein